MTKITKFIGYVFIGSWALLGAFFYIKAVIEFIDLKDTTMTEHKVITLDENDIKEIIADKFDCDLCDVEIEVSHGDPQYPQTSVYIEVDLN